jgi:hypothetical protein
VAKPKLFSGKESKAEENAEARAVKSGKITKKQYAAGEKREEKKAKKKG